jgi:hypothetical protein
LFERVPEWTEANLLPLFDWSSPDAHDVWESRRFAGSTMSPRFFQLTKAAFMGAFGRSDLQYESLSHLVDCLTFFVILNKYRDDQIYDVSMIEARAAIRRAGAAALPSVGSRLAIEMKAIEPQEKLSRWRSLIRPVFEAIWPFDPELQSHQSTSRLIDLLLASGEAFSEAIEFIAPFVQQDRQPSHSVILFSLVKADEAFYIAAPERMLDLFYAVVGEAASGSVSRLSEALSRVAAAAPDLTHTRKFQKLLGFAAPS